MEGQGEEAEAEAEVEAEARRIDEEANEVEERHPVEGDGEVGAEGNVGDEEAGDAFTLAQGLALGFLEYIGAGRQRRIIFGF